MNINITLPESFLSRYLSAIERLASAAERIAGPPVDPEVVAKQAEFKPYPPSMWETMTNAKLLSIEEEERQEALGYGSAYQQQFEAVAKQQRSTLSPDD